MQIVSFKDNIKYDETIKFNRGYTSPLALTGLILKTHDKLDSQKTNVKQNQ